MVRVLATVGRLLRAVTALAALAGAVAGVPWLLTASAGWPLAWIGWPRPTDLPALADMADAVTTTWSDQMLLSLIASIGWALWGVFIRHVAVEVVEASVHAAAIRRGRPRPPAPGRGPIRWVAAVLVGAIAGAVLIDAARTITGPAGASATAAAADAAAHRPAVAVAPAQPGTTAPIVHAGPRPAITMHTDTPTTRPALASAVHDDRDVPAWARDAPGGVHRVAAGDNLWRLAEHTLGDPHRWREIYTLNRGHQQANGYSLTDPDEIHIGWILALPARDTTPVQPAPSDPTTSEPAPAEPDGQTTDEPADTTSEPSTDTGANSTPAAETSTTEHGHETTSDHDEAGIRLPSHGWVSLGLAALITTVATLLRLQRRRHARLRFPIPTHITAQPTPVPACLTPIDAVAARDRSTDDETDRPTAPIGLDADGGEVNLFDLPGPGLALTGDGAEPAARALLAATLSTGATQSAEARPVVVTTAEILTRLLPEGAPLVGLDPDSTSYDGERLIVLSDAAAAITHAEEEMIMRRRLLDTFDLDSITALNTRTDHAEAQPRYVLLIEATGRHTARLRAVGAHRPALDLHPVALGPLDGIPTIEITADGTTTGGGEAAETLRLSTLTAGDLAAVLAMLTDAAARPEPGHDIDLDPAPNYAVDQEASTEAAPPIPAQPSKAAAPVRLRVLGPVLIDTETGPVTTGMRSGSYTVLASLAVHPNGRTLDQLAADLHPDTDPGTAGKRIRTDISTIRRVLRTATDTEAMFVVYDPATNRYRLDPELIAVDLWQMLTTIERANRAKDDTAALTALRQAVEWYRGDFADGGDHPWILDHATTYRHQILSALARIAEITETDHPDQAIAALERALEYDPVNEELHQRIMRIHGRAGRPDAVRRTLRRLEQCLTELGDAEPSEATRRVAARQLQPTTAGDRR